MQTILRILKQAGGWHHGLYLKIENPPYMALVIEATDESGPCGLPAISVCHYGEQNGDLMRDPEMCFELGLGRRGAPEPLLLPERLCRRRAVEPLHRPRPLRLPRQLAPAARAIRQTVGQQPAFAGLRRSLRAAADPTRLTLSRPERDRARPLHNPNAVQPLKESSHARQQRIPIPRHRHHPRVHHQPPPHVR
jgi:hypothetical protein